MCIKMGWWQNTKTRIGSSWMCGWINLAASNLNFPCQVCFLFFKKDNGRGKAIYCYSSQCVLCIMYIRWHDVYKSYSIAGNNFIPWFIFLIAEKRLWCLATLFLCHFLDGYSWKSSSFMLEWFSLFEQAAQVNIEPTPRKQIIFFFTF